MKSHCNDIKVEILVKSTYTYVYVIYSTQNQGNFTIISETLSLFLSNYKEYLYNLFVLRSCINWFAFYTSIETNAQLCLNYLKVSER